MSFLAKAGKTIRQNRNIVLAYVAMLVLLTAVSIYRPGFGWGDPRHLRALVLQAAVIGLASMGQTVVIISGGADLSVPWTLTGAAIIMTMMTQGQNASMLWAVPIVLFGCMIVGFLNGIGVTVLGVAPMIMTLAMNYILLGLIAGIGMGGVATMGQYGQPPELILTAGTGTVGEIPYLIIIWLVLAIMLTVLLGRTGFGRRVYAVGTSQSVSEYSGVKVRRTLILVYMLSAVLNGAAGILLAGKFGRAYLGMGDPYLFVSFSAVIIGGASIFGGSGSYIGTIGGSLLLAVLLSLLPVLNMPRPFQLIIYGLVVLLAVLFSMMRFRSSRSRVRAGVKGPD
jgi:ribose transport system permease protein